MRQPQLRSINIETTGRHTVFIAFDDPRMIRAHPEDAGVQAFDECRALQSEDQGRGMRVHVPYRAIRTEPTRIAFRPGKVEAAEELGSDIPIEVGPDLVLDELMRQ